MTRTVSLAAALLALIACSGSDDSSIRGVGTLELIETDIAPMVPARVLTVRVREGDSVSAGDTLIALSRATVAPDIELRRASVAAAEAALRDLLAGPRPAELERAAAELRSLEADAFHAERDAERMEALLEAGSISMQQLDAARTAARAARARVDAATESLRLLRQGARPQQIAAARAELERARAALAAALEMAGELVLIAPIDGVVLARHAEAGEILAAAEPALTIGDPTRPWVRIFVPQSAFPLVSVGDDALAVLDAFPDRTFRGRVVSLARRAEFTPRVALTESERADLLFGVRVEFTDTTGMLKAGLPATVTIRPGTARARAATSGNDDVTDRARSGAPAGEPQP